MQLHIADDVEKILWREIVSDGHKEDTRLGVVQMTALDRVKQGELVVKSIVKPAMYHVDIVVECPC